MVSKRDGRQTRVDRDPCSVRVHYAAISAADGRHGEYYVGMSKNLSLSGVCLMTRKEIPAPTLVRIKIPVPGSSGTMLLLGKVMRCQKGAEEGAYEIGVRFVGVLPNDLKKMLVVLNQPTPAEPKPAPVSPSAKRG